MDKEAIKHVIKTRYLNSYKVIVAGGRDFVLMVCLMASLSILPFDNSLPIFMFAH
jgi:hypothetical protein